MDHALIPLKLDLSTQRLGRPQQSGAMTVLPLFAPGANGKFTPPLTAFGQNEPMAHGLHSCS